MFHTERIFTPIRGTLAATTVPDDLEIGLNIMIAHKGTTGNDFNVDYVQTVQQR